jgi:hypothetical protein
MEQRALEVDLIVPDNRPDIEQIIDIYVKNLEVSSIDVLRDRVIVRGSLELKVMYVADLPNQPVHAFEKRNIRFVRDIEILGTEPGMTASADATVEFVDYDREYECRQVRVTAVVKVWARVVNAVNMEVQSGEMSSAGLGYYGYGTMGVSVQPGIEFQTEADMDEFVPEMAPEAPDMLQTPTGVMPEMPMQQFPEAPEEAEYPEFPEEYQGEVPQAITPQIPAQPETVPEETPAAAPEAAPAEEETTEGAVMKVKGRTVNVRTGPGTNFPVVVQVQRGESVTITDQAFGWYKVNLSDGTAGWIASWLLQAPKG